MLTIRLILCMKLQARVTLLKRDNDVASTLSRSYYIIVACLPRMMLSD